MSVFFSVTLMHRSVQYNIVRLKSFFQAKSLNPMYNAGISNSHSLAFCQAPPFRVVSLLDVEFSSTFGGSFAFSHMVSNLLALSLSIKISRALRNTIIYLSITIQVIPSACGIVDDKLEAFDSQSPLSLFAQARKGRKGRGLRQSKKKKTQQVRLNEVPSDIVS